MTPRAHVLRWRRALVGAVAIALGALGEARAERPRLERAPAQRFAEGLLWRVEPAHAAVAPSFLYGTIHLGEQAIGAVPGAVERAVATSTTVCGEVDLDPSTLLSAAFALFRNDGGTLERDLGGTLYRRVEARLAAKGIPPAMCQSLKPAFALLLLQTPDAAGAEVPLDFRLLAQARADGKGTCGIETIEEQLGSVEGIPLAEVRVLLEQVLRDEERSAGEVRAMVEAWRDERLDRLASMMAGPAHASHAEQRATATLLERLLDQRNLRMVARIRPLVDAGGAFVAVGAAHLAGDRGLLVALDRAGYRLTRIPAPPGPIPPAVQDRATDPEPAAPERRRRDRRSPREGSLREDLPREDLPREDLLREDDDVHSSEDLP